MAAQEGNEEYKNVHGAFMKELGDLIRSESSTFACGGSIPIVASGGSDKSPIVLRWDSYSSTSGVAKLAFPIETSIKPSTTGLNDLIAACQPATFGYKGEDVLDETYRKATKMDRSTFSVDFCPYELGIVDTIAQILLPNAGSRFGTKGVKAELYNLNIYNAPSGFFKPHVDTPRSETQFGSLVVSLPCHYEGGALVVRHAGQSIKFDWGILGSANQSKDSVQWAAFYSDCEHEVLEVTQGHRITLTYNLYHTVGNGELAGNSPVMDVTTLPLYRKVKEALAAPEFMSDGGTLGVFCQHAYAHSTPEGIKSFPGVLKGSDMAVYEVFLALGFDVSIRSILDIKENEFDYLQEYFEERESEFGEEHPYKGKDVVAEGLRELELSETYMGDSYGQLDVIESWGGEWLKINWLTNPNDGNVGLIYKAGNLADLGHAYTHAAIIISIPSESKYDTE